jgi:AraC-like DNA-binding protein
MRRWWRMLIITATFLSRRAVRMLFFSVRDQRQPLTDETAVLINAWELHAYEHHDPKAPRTVVLALYIEPDWLTAIQHPLSLSRHGQFFRHSCVQLTSHTRKLADELVMETWWSDALTPARVEHLLFDLMISVIEPIHDWRAFAAVMRSYHLQPSDARIRRAIACLREHVGAELNMDELAARCGLSRAHFFTLFRQCTKLTPQVYANVLRMETAINNLSHRRKTLGQISYDLGFSAPSHFTRFFREHLGIAPSEYRRVVDLYEVQEHRQIEI